MVSFLAGDLKTISAVYAASSYLVCAVGPFFGADMASA